jgi:hypothetical protein
MSKCYRAGSTFEKPQAAKFARRLFQSTLTFALICAGTHFAVAQAVHDARDDELCRIFREKAAAVNEAYAESKPEGFSSVQATVDCTERAYAQNVYLTALAAASIGQVADQIKASYVSETCEDRRIWDIAFGRGWKTSFYFANPREETVLTMTLSSCEPAE